MPWVMYTWCQPELATAAPPGEAVDRCLDGHAYRLHLAEQW
jgi:hypothetical protein